MIVVSNVGLTASTPYGVGFPAAIFVSSRNTFGLDRII